MAKNWKRADLMKLANELQISLLPSKMAALLDTAAGAKDPEAYLRGVAAEHHSPPRDQESPPATPPLDFDHAGAVQPIDQIGKVKIDDLLTPGVSVHSQAADCCTGPVAIKVTDVAAVFCLELPALDVPSTGHRTKHCSVQLTRNPLASEALTRLRAKLNADHAQLASGRHVDNPSAALIWLLEQYGKAAGLVPPA